MLVVSRDNFLLNLGCITYVRYELSIHEIVPFEVFLFLIFEKKKKKINKERKKKKEKRKRKKKKNKRQIQLISFSCGKNFVVRG